MSFWNNDKQHGIKTDMRNNGLYYMFWNNVKQHGVKTDRRNNGLYYI